MRRLLLGSVLAAVLVLLVPTAANADAARVRDARGDAPAGLDITSATFSTYRQLYSMKLTVRGLGPSGHVRMLVSPLSDWSYRIEVTRGGGGTVRTRCLFIDYTRETTTRVSCGNRRTVTWNARKDLVRVGVRPAFSGPDDGYNPFVFQAETVGARGAVADKTAEKTLRK